MSSLRTSTAILVFAFMVFIHINGKSAKHASCGRQRLNTNPMMNQTFNAGSWPWHAAIYYQKKYQCVATLISENSVVTSGHCVANDVPTEVEVRLGSSKFETAMQSFGVVKIFLHPNYNEETFNNDIAVLRLSSYAVYNEFIQPICLWPSDQTYLSEFVGKDGTVIRWEITETNEPSMSLQEVSMRIISHMDCLGSDLRPYISTTNFCARLPNDTNVSQLNSGGSLIYRGNDELYYIRGIVSVAPIFNSTRHNALFTDVARYLPWIEDMKNNCDKVVQCEEIGELTEKTSNIKHVNEVKMNRNSKIADETGFGDTLTSIGRKDYASFIPFHKEVSNSQEASYKASSKLDEDVMTLNSDDGEHLIGHKRNSDSKEYLELCQFQEQIFGDTKYET